MRRLCLAVLGTLLLFGCGSSVEPDDGSGGAGASQSSGSSGNTGGTSSNGTSSEATGTSVSGTGGGPPSGDCATDADCPNGKCIELAPGGYKVCASLPMEATMCSSTEPTFPDECCTSADCRAGACYSTTVLPYCGGPAISEYNICVADQCQTDDDCIHDNPEPWICIPAGAWGWPANACRTAYCHTNADCTARAGGVCAPIENTCCGIPYGLACVYPGGCTKDEDCAPDFTQHCEIDAKTGTARCADGGLACPA